MSRTTIIVVILIVCIAGGAILLRRSPPPEEARTQAEQISLTGYGEDGSPAWSIEAQSGSSSTKHSALQDVKLTLLGDPDAPLIVHGDRLSRSSAGSELMGSIRVERIGVLTLETEALFWDEHNDVLEAGPVRIEMDATHIEAGAFHHSLDTGLTTLLQGIQATITRGNREYTAQSNSAQATADLVALIGDVTIQAESGDSYTCQRLESESGDSTIRLMGDVLGQWQGSGFAADTVFLDSTGIRLHDHVTMDLDLLMMDEPHDS